MANTLTNLIPAMTRAADTVSRELVGFIPAVYLNADASQAAKDQTIYYPVAPAVATADITPAATGPSLSDVTIGNASMSISKSKYAPVGAWTGEEQLGLGGLYDKIIEDAFAQAYRVLLNEVEADLAALYKYGSRAYGTAATTPFATAGTLTDASEVRRILIDNGAPQSDLQLVIDSAAGAKIRGMQSQAHMQGSDSIMRQGVLLDLMGMSIRESAQVKAHTAGTAASATTDNAGYAVGDTTITLASAGTGTILAGDIISHARDTRKYTVITGDADVSGGGTFVLNSPGLRQTVTAATSALTLTASYTANMAFHRNAIHLLCRTPALPKGGDSAVDVRNVTDPRSGITFQVCHYKQFRQEAIIVGLAWGVKAVKSAHMATLIG